MANELTLTWTLAITKDNLSISQPESFQANVATALGPIPGSQNIGTTAEQIDLSAFTNDGGWGWAKNLDQTNYVEFGLFVSSTFYPFHKLLPGESYPFRMADLNASAPLYAQANTAAVNIQFNVYEE